MKTKKTMRSKWALLLLVVLAFIIAGCGGNGKATTTSAGDVKATREAPLPENNANEEKRGEAMEGKTVIEITMESGGVIAVELDANAAPVSVANFLKLIDEEFYDGLTFHRIIKNFMIQGGCPDGTGMGGPKERIKGEFAANGWDNPISHTKGVISMARSGDPNSAGSQFFITNTDATFLDGDYAAFGHVISGIEVVDEISAVTTGAGDRPNDPVVIKTIRRQ